MPGVNGFNVILGPLNPWDFLRLIFLKILHFEEVLDLELIVKWPQEYFLTSIYM